MLSNYDSFANYVGTKHPDAINKPERTKNPEDMNLLIKKDGSNAMHRSDDYREESVSREGPDLERLPSKSVSLSDTSVNRRSNRETEYQQNTVDIQPICKQSINNVGKAKNASVRNEVDASYEKVKGPDLERLPSQSVLLSDTSVNRRSNRETDYQQKRVDDSYDHDDEFGQRKTDNTEFYKNSNIDHVERNDRNAIESRRTSRRVDIQEECSFKTVSSKPCNTIQGSSLITSLSACKNDIANHLRNCLLQREGLIKNEDDLLRFRGGYFEESSSSLTICPTHRYEFGVTWRKSVYCVLQFACGGNKKPRKARQDCSVNCKQSLYMWKEEQRLIPVGSGVCVACRIELIGRMKLFEEEPIIQHKQLEMTEAINVDRVMDTVDNNDKDSMCEVMELSQSTASTFSDASEWPLDMASSQSTCSTVQLNSPMRKRMALNSFLEEVGISPVKKVLSVDWMSASHRTKSDYERKAKQIMEQVLSILTPGQENQLEIFLSEG
ncbi:unnamed protein product [Mytilus coruscus]|uniref:Uncharacterized protein n=1 Tax=Mytilus coruscus TaxID=42192 RepID=A0A6J8C108_MYTCO|nr:unnamed protein product [Mytilus coruscus]